MPEEVKSLPLQNSTEIIEQFTPTSKMYDWLETAKEIGFTSTITDLSEKSGVDRKTWYNWIKLPQFVEWWDNEWQKHIRLNRWKLDAIGMKKAETDYAYWKDMMERVGNITPTPAGGNNQVNNFINLDKYVK